MKQILIDISKCLACKSCEIACAVVHSESKELTGAMTQDKRPKQRVYVEAGQNSTFPLQCRHCEDARCVQACMSGAMIKDPLTGIVGNNPDKCVGCWMCVMVCPFGAITQDTDQRVALKCDRCAEMDIPACVRACPAKAIKFVEPDQFGKISRKQYLTRFQLAEEGTNNEL